MMNDIVLVTTIFDASKKYLDDFFKSLEYQSENKFDVLVVNDGVEKFDLFKDKFPNLNIIEFNCSKSPAKNRQVGISLAKNRKYKKIIWGDSDDFFPENRIYEISKLLDSYNIVANDLHSYENGKIKKNLFGNLYEEGLYNLDDIIDKNIIGFSNLGVNSKIIPDNINFSDDLIAIDWFFATILLLNNNEFFFTKKTYSFYRQHENNTIGANNNIDITKINFSLKTKLIHYHNLILQTKENRKFNKLFKEKFCDLKNLKNKLLDSDFEEYYKLKINSKLDQKFYGWWGEILTNKQLEKNEN